MKHAEVFEKLRPELEAAATAARVRLPQPDSHIVDDVNYIRQPIWTKDGYTFMYMIDGVLTFDEVVKSYPKDRVGLQLSTDDDIRQLGKEIRNRYGNDREITLLGYTPKTPFCPAEFMLDLPAVRVDELRQMANKIKKITLVEPTNSQRQKQKDFLVALLSDAHEGSRSNDLKHVKLQDLRPEEIFGSDLHNIGFLRYNDLLGLLKEGYIIDENTYRNLISMMG